MKAKERTEKDKIKLRYSTAFNKALNDSEFKSFRELALSVGLEPAHIQRIATGKVNVVLTTVIALVEGLGISFNVFGKYYDEVSESDIMQFLEALEERKGPKIKKKPARKKSTSRKK